MTDLEQTFDISRNPSDYRPSNHVFQRKKERRMIDYDIIGEAIEDGDVVEVDQNDNGKHDAVIHYDWLNSTFRVVVGIEECIVESAYEIRT